MESHSCLFVFIRGSFRAKGSERIRENPGNPWFSILRNYTPFCHPM